MQPLERVLELSIQRHLRKALALDPVVEHLVCIRYSPCTTQRPDECRISWSFKLHRGTNHGFVNIDGLVELLVLAEPHEQSVVCSLIRLASLGLHLLEESKRSHGVALDAHPVHQRGVCDDVREVASGGHGVEIGSCLGDHPGAREAEDEGVVGDEVGLDAVVLHAAEDAEDTRGVGGGAVRLHEGVVDGGVGLDAVVGEDGEELRDLPGLPAAADGVGQREQRGAWRRGGGRGVELREEAPRRGDGAVAREAAEEQREGVRRERDGAGRGPREVDRRVDVGVGRRADGCGEVGGSLDRPLLYRRRRGGRGRSRGFGSLGWGFPVPGIAGPRRRRGLGSRSMGGLGKDGEGELGGAHGVRHLPHRPRRRRRRREFGNRMVTEGDGKEEAFGP